MGGNSLSTQFEKPGKKPRMDSARYINPHTGEQYVVRMGGIRAEKKEQVYVHRYHYGHLLCVDCDAKVHARSTDRAAVSGSTFKPSEPYFALSAGQKHSDECRFKAESAVKTPARKAFDKTAGYRIHINTQEHNLYTKVEGVYARKGAITKIVKEGLSEREAVTVSSVKDFVELMEKAEPARLRNSVVIFNNEETSWDNFFIRYNRKGTDQPRWMSLFQRLKAAPRGTQLPCLMEMRVDKPRVVSGYSKNRSVQSQRIPFRRTEEGAAQDIIPSAQLDRDAAITNVYISSAFSFGRNYLVLGLVTLNQAKDGNYYLNISISHPDQIASVNIENIAKASAERSQRRMRSGAKTEPAGP